MQHEGGTFSNYVIAISPISSATLCQQKLDDRKNPVAIMREQIIEENLYSTALRKG